MTEESPNTPSPLHPTTPSKRVDIGETLLALAAVVLGILILWQATLIRLTPAYSKVGPRVIPYIVGAGLVIAGVWLAYEALTGRASSAATESEDADPTLPTDWGTVGLLALALVVYLVLIERAGFIIASATLFVMAAFAMGSRRLARDIAIGVILASVLYLVFNRGLGLSLPAGVLTGVVQLAGKRVDPSGIEAGASSVAPTSRLAVLASRLATHGSRLR